MCIFSGQVQHVGGTKIFARLKPDPANGTSQYLVYSMSVSTATDVAMILPLPVSTHAEDAVQFIALDGYPEFFEDMQKGFPRIPTKGHAHRGIALSVGAPAVLEVHEVGDFVASFVPRLADFGRIDARFRLPAGTWDQLPQYREWGFAVFQLKGTVSLPGKSPGKGHQIHPMAFRFPTKMAGALYFPTLHIHDGKVNEEAGFDHILYFQGEPFREFAEFYGVTESNAVSFMKVGKAKGIIQPDAMCFKRRIGGKQPNRDTIATQPSDAL